MGRITNDEKADIGMVIIFIVYVILGVLLINGILWLLY